MAVAHAHRLSVYRESADEEARGAHQTLSSDRVSCCFALAKAAEKVDDVCTHLPLSCILFTSASVLSCH